MAEHSIVLDNGSSTIFAGFAEEDDPTSVFPNLCGKDIRNNKQVDFIDLSKSESYNQFVSSQKNGELKINYPMEHGVINNWEIMEAIWEHTFSVCLGVSSTEFNLLITEAIMNPKPNREKMAQILFEKFNFPAVSISQSGLMPLYSAGLTTGIVLDVGEGVTQTVPVWGGYPITDAMARGDLGGKDVTIFLEKLLRQKGQSAKPREIIKLIKENACYVSKNIGSDSTSPSEPTTFQLPDGETIKLGDERFLCSELLFNPSAMEFSDKIGIHEMLYKSIMKTNMDIRKDLYGNIVVTGGSTLFPGFVERLTEEINALVPPKAKLHIVADPQRKYATWRGASVLASLSNFTRLLNSKEEYEEIGPSIMHKNK